jgi:hypothetical protein
LSDHPLFHWLPSPAARSLSTGLFFNRWTTTTRQADAICRSVSKLGCQFLHSPPDSLLVHAGDSGKQADPTATYSPGFQGYVPATLLFIQATQKQIHLSMQFLIGMVSLLAAMWTLTDVHL